MQSTHQGAERIRRLAPTGHLHNINRRVEADDQREERRRQTKVRARLHAVHAGTHVPVDERAQAPGGAPNRTVGHWISHPDRLGPLVPQAEAPTGAPRVMRGAYSRVSPKTRPVTIPATVRLIWDLPEVSETVVSATT